MPIDTLKSKRRLVEEYGLDDRQAEGIVELIAQSEERGATASDVDAAKREVLLRLQATEERLEQQLESEIVASEQRLESKIAASEQQLESKIAASEQQLESKIVASEQRLESKIVASEQRLESKIVASEQQLESKIAASEQRLESKITSTEKRLGKDIEQLRLEMEQMRRQVLQWMLGIAAFITVLLTLFEYVL
jgi:Fe2+ transport system protein B